MDEERPRFAASPEDLKNWPPEYITKPTPAIVPVEMEAHKNPSSQRPTGRRRNSSLSKFFEDSPKLPSSKNRSFGTLDTPLLSGDSPAVAAGADGVANGPSTVKVATRPCPFRVPPARGDQTPLRSQILRMYLAHVALESNKSRRGCLSPGGPDRIDGMFSELVTPLGYDKTDDQRLEDLREAVRRLESDFNRSRNHGNSPETHSPSRFDLTKVYPEPSHPERENEPALPLNDQPDFYTIPEKASERRRKNRETNVMAPVSF